MKIGTENSASYEPIETGIHIAELIEYTDTMPDGSPMMSRGFQGSQPRAQWRFRFELIEEGDTGRTISSWINKPANENDLRPNANVVLMAQALLPNLAVGEEWELEDLLHQRCRILVDEYTRNDGTVGNKVSKFYPLLAPKPVRVATQPAAPARQPVMAGQGSRPMQPASPTRRAAAVQEDVPPLTDDDAPPF